MVMPSQMGDAQPQQGMMPPGAGGQPQGMPQGMPSDMAPEGEPGGMPPMEGMEEMEDPVEEQQEQLQNVLDKALQDTNLARKLKNKKTESGDSLLDTIGAAVVDGYEKDELSREEWMRLNKEWLKMALLVRENKSFPWPRASNIKYPLLATAAMQFSARAYPALVPSDGKVVKARVIPTDPQGKLSAKAQNIARHMSYQVMCKIPDWEEDMDKLLMTVAISGICFKKTYFDPFEQVIMSKIVYPENFCVNYWAKSLEEAYRKTEIFYLSPNTVREKVANREEFLDVDLGTPSLAGVGEQDLRSLSTGNTAPESSDGSTPFQFLCCHTFWDLDNDGYEEPYAITVHKDTRKVVRIVARWESKGFHTDDKGKVIKIVPLEYFTAFPFIPNPDGSLYAVGFGLLLGPLNESINSNINQLTDAGTLNNMQSGFIGKGLRLKMGQSTFQPGEWKLVNATGDDLHKQIVPLPAKEPSAVLMALLQMLITSGNQLASIAEIMVGKMPGQNTPATTTQESVKQGMAVFTAIYKRIYRSLESEFKKIYRLNRITPGIAAAEGMVLGITLAETDYDDDDLIIPGGDPTGDSEATKSAKVQKVGQLLQLGTIDPMQFTIWAMETEEIPNYQKLLKQPAPPPPDPKAQALQMKAEIDQQKATQDMEMKREDMDLKAQAQQMELEFKRQLAMIEADRAEAKLEAERTREAMKMQGQEMETKMNAMRMVLDQHYSARKSQQDLEHTRVSGQQKLAHQEATNAQKLSMASRQAKQKPKGNGASKPK